MTTRISQEQKALMEQWLRRIQEAMDACTETLAKSTMANDPVEMINDLATAHSNLFGAGIRLYVPQPTNQ